MPRKLTAQEVEKFWSEMCKHYGTKWKFKKDAWEAKLIAKILDSRGIVKYDNWMENYATILGRTIYLPFIPGQLTDDFYSEKQVSMAVHEHQHYHDACDRGKITWSWEYLTDKSKRAFAEASGYRTNIEMYHWYTGKIIPPSVIGNLLQKSYDCDIKDVVLVEDLLERFVKRLKFGRYESPATLVALDILEDIMTERI